MPKSHNQNVIGEIPAFEKFKHEQTNQSLDEIKKAKRRKILRFSLMILLGLSVLANVIIFFYLNQ